MKNLFEDRRLRNKRFVFQDRTDAGQRLARFLGSRVRHVPQALLPWAREVAKDKVWRESAI